MRLYHPKSDLIYMSEGLFTRNEINPVTDINCIR